MRRDYVGLWSPAIGAEGGLLAYGHHGRPLLAFQSEQGRCSDYEDRGMIDAVAGLIEAGRVKVYSVDSYDADSWCDPDLPLAPKLLPVSSRHFPKTPLRAVWKGKSCEVEVHQGCAALQ